MSAKTLALISVPHLRSLLPWRRATFIDCESNHSRSARLRIRILIQSGTIGTCLPPSVRTNLKWKKWNGLCLRWTVFFVLHALDDNWILLNLGRNDKVRCLRLRFVEDVDNLFRLQRECNENQSKWLPALWPYCRKKSWRNRRLIIFLNDDFDLFGVSAVCQIEIDDEPGRTGYGRRFAVGRGRSGAAAAQRHRGPARPRRRRPRRAGPQRRPGPSAGRPRHRRHRNVGPGRRRAGRRRRCRCVRAAASALRRLNAFFFAHTSGWGCLFFRVAIVPSTRTAFFWVLWSWLMKQLVWPLVSSFAFLLVRRCPWLCLFFVPFFHLEKDSKFF